LVAKLKQGAEEMKVGPGRDRASGMGPVIIPEASDRVTATLAAAHRRAPHSSSTGAG
jgi:acyl-CoA reductase-like NAD-dependent aldehyde dehydrogenase